MVPRGLVPPRPNLGPEPWTDEQPISVVAVATVAMISLLLAWVFWRLLKRGRARAAKRAVLGAIQSDTTPRGQFLALSDSIREALFRQFGSAWRAKTTEELSADPQLEHALGQEPLQELILFLDQVDRLKFAPERSNHYEAVLGHELGTWKPRVALLVERIEAKRNGRLKRKDPNFETSGSKNAGDRRFQGVTSALVNRTATTSVR
jgi:hypothetical protein